MVSELSNITNITDLALRYYKEKGKEYTRTQARKQFYQQKNRDVELIKRIQGDLYKEAMAIIAALNP